MTESANGVTTEIDSTPAEVGIAVQNDHITGVQLIAKRPAQ